MAEGHAMPGSGSYRRLIHNKTRGTLLPQRWIPVSERLPEPKQTVLVCHYLDVGIQATYAIGAATWLPDVRSTRVKERWLFEPSSGPMKVSHWMPLPPPPSE